MMFASYDKCVSPWDAFLIALYDTEFWMKFSYDGMNSTLLVAPPDISVLITTLMVIVFNSIITSNVTWNVKNSKEQYPIDASATPPDT